MDYVTYYIYLCEGYLVIFICSIKEFRVQKEFIIYVGVLLYDAFFGLSHVFAGSIRIQVYLTEKYIPLYTPWMCFHLPQVYLWSITTPATGIITIVSAIDRFISIMYPLTYYQLRSRYSFFMISTPLLISCVFVVIEGFQCYELRNVYNVHDNNAMQGLD
uniref:G-protein coupled receptors family 1 profile domain-containing protein n=1 Tax=Panagrolaimus davidi TaxID=227884 RepID=A0A914PLR4_9BILA